MKKKFSTKWKASKQPRKQRKYLANAPLHIKRKMLSINLSKDLRKTHKKRNVPVRKGDTVKVLRGKFKKKQGKVLMVNVKLSKVTIEGIQIQKKEGSKVNVKLRPSNLQIVELSLEDKKRFNNSKNAETKTPKKEESKELNNKKKEKKNAP